MGRFTYELPENFQKSFVHFLDINGNKNLAHLIMKSNIEYSNLGYAHYAGVRGDVWDKYALDFTIESDENTISKMKSLSMAIKEWLRKFLNPNKTGYLVRYVEFLVRDSGIEIALPEKCGDDFETLSQDIADALAKNEPVLVLDRLHTFSVKYIREICHKHSIPIATPNGQMYPLQSLAGSLVKYYESNNVFGSDFAKQALKMSISLFDSYNAIRNDRSFAHDNSVLDKK